MNRKLRVAVPVAQYHPGTTAEYVIAALSQLGHNTELMNAKQFYDASRDTSASYDLFLCVDSGESINFADIPTTVLKHSAFWFIDFRHNKNRATRQPNDLKNSRIVSRGGGWVFQAQLEDAEFCLATDISRCSWLPLGADTAVWSNAPASNKSFHFGFAGNVWDGARKSALEQLISIPNSRLGFGGAGKIWKEDAAALLRRSVIGFNISSFYGETWAYDVNMRVFETLSCGVPLLTNNVPTLWKIFPKEVSYIKTYNSIEELRDKAIEALSDKKFLSSGTEARQFIEANATYVIRIREALNILYQNNVIKS